MSDFQPTGIFLRETTFRFLLIIEKSWQEWMDGQVKFLEGWRKTQANPPSMVTSFNTSLEVMANRWKHKQIQQWANEIRQKSPSVDEDCRTLCKEYVRQSCEEGKVNDRQLQVYLPRFETLLGVLCVYLAENPVFRDGQCVRRNHDHVRKNMRSAIADSIRHSLRETVTWQFTAEEIREKPVVHQVELTPVVVTSKPQRDDPLPLVDKWDHFTNERSGIAGTNDRGKNPLDRDLIDSSASLLPATLTRPPRTPQPSPPPFKTKQEKPRSAFPRPGTPVPRSVALPLHRLETLDCNRLLSSSSSQNRETTEQRNEPPRILSPGNQNVETRNHYEPIEEEEDDDGFKVPSTPARRSPTTPAIRSFTPVREQPLSKTPVNAGQRRDRLSTPVRELSSPVRQPFSTTSVPTTLPLPHRMTPEIQQKAQRLSFPLSVPPPVSSPIPPSSSTGCAVLPFPSSPYSAPSKEEETEKEFAESETKNRVSSLSGNPVGATDPSPMESRTVSISVPLCPQ